MSHGDKLMVALGVAYFVIGCVYAYEGNWPKMFYWLGALIITMSVLAMK